MIFGDRISCGKGLMRIVGRSGERVRRAAIDDDKVSIRSIIIQICRAINEGG